jgi:hypothetical protein
MPIEFFQITAAYSNAMLVAVLPHVADFAKKLDLPTPQPITMAEVATFACFNRSDHIGGRVVLTNGCEFVFDHGRIQRFDSPHSFFYLQDPSLIPKFYGSVKLSKEQALQIARTAIRKLGYTEAALFADNSPEIVPPKKDGTNYIARYRFRWRDPTRGSDPDQPALSIDFEIDSTMGRIWMLDIPNPNTFAADLKLGVSPQVINRFGDDSGIPVGPGRKVTPVSGEYARAFLLAILPQISDFVKRGKLPVEPPASEKDVDMAKYLAKYNCGIVEGSPRAFIDTRSGDRFIYRHGRIIAFYSVDAMDNPERKRAYTFPEIDKDHAKFFGPVNITTNEAVALVRRTVKELGYSETILHVDVPPRISGPNWWGTNRIPRCFIEWRESPGGAAYANSEVDMASKTLKSFYVNDDVITNYWRTSPKISVTR